MKDKAVLIYGFYSLLIVLSGSAGLLIHLSRTGTLVGELATPVDIYQAAFQLLIFLFVAIMAFLLRRNEKYSKGFLAGLLMVLVWYVVFELLTFGWARESSVMRVIASLFYIVLPTLYVFYVVLKRTREQAEQQSG